MSLCELLGMDLPIIQAPMAGSNGAALAIAVSNAGGLGSLPCAMLTPDGMRAELRALLAGTRKPYLLNFFCHTPPVPDPARESRWRALLAPYYSEYGLDPNATVSAPARAPFTAEAADLLEEFRPPVVSFHFGLPSPELLARVRGWGAKVLANATSLEEARWLESRGVDAIVAQGREAGGHSGMFLSQDPSRLAPTFELVTRLVRAVSVPVIAAGGIGDAASVARALDLGAAGVQVGTAYLLCPEATTSAVHRAALQSDSVRDTAFTNLISGRPARGVVNRVMRELGPMSAAPPAFPLAASALAPLRAKAESLGLGDFSPLWCGQNGSPKPLPAGEVTRELASSASGRLRKSGS